MLGDWQDAPVEPIFRTIATYVMRSFLLATSGIAAGFIANELFRRSLASFQASQARDREQQEGELKPRFMAEVSHEVRTRSTRFWVSPIFSPLTRQQTRAMRGIRAHRRERQASAVGRERSHQYLGDGR